MIRIWNLPNTITISRFFLCIVIFLMLALLPARDAWLKEWEGIRQLQVDIILIVFIVAAVTDFLDGWLARRSGQVTRFGRMADPFVDKILVCGTMLFLCARPAPDTGALLAPWMVAVVLAREFLVSAIRSLAEAEGIPFPAERLGKYKLVFQCLAIGWLIGSIGDWPTTNTWVTPALVWVALALTVVSGLGYVRKAREVLAQ